MSEYMIVDPKRVHEITSEGYIPFDETFKWKDGGECIVYWMSRDQRIDDNWALLACMKQARERRVPIRILFTLVPEFLDATLRHYHFMLHGLEEVQNKARDLGIPFHLILDQDPAKTVISFSKEMNAGMVITDFDPLKIKLLWKKQASVGLECPFYEVDAHNVIPARFISQKTEFAAYTLRPKIHKALDRFLIPFPDISTYKQIGLSNDIRFFTEEILKKVRVRKDIQPVNTFKPGTEAANSNLSSFINQKLNEYGVKRNDPNAGYISDMSPWLHFGNISSQTIALAVKKQLSNKESIDSFLEELIVRKELADNYCLYTNDYDNFNGFHNWAQTSLNAHRSDIREFTYTQEQFEQAATHDPLWNAAQCEMVNTGKMHGYMRMYWAKKILEWTKSPEEAQAIAIYLNDTYELDGRDANGYTGIAWSIGGVHDRAWFERPIFGKIRYMNANGCKSKFDVKQYIARHMMDNTGNTLF
jgi:deoxyribodipyrimidine photo-lyase